MIEMIFNAIFALLIKMVGLIFLPIDLLVEQYLPNLAQAFTAVADFLGLITTSLGWAISATGIPYLTLAFLAIVMIFKLTFPLLIWTIKIVVQWVHHLK